MLSEVTVRGPRREVEAHGPFNFMEFISDSQRFPIVTMLLLLDAGAEFDFGMFMSLVTNSSKVRPLCSFGRFRRRAVATCGKSPGHTDCAR